MPKRHYKWDLPEDNEALAKKHRAEKFDYEDERFINMLYDLAGQGYYDYEIAKKTGVDPITFSKKMVEHPVMAQALAKGRETIEEMGCERPSVPYFRELISQCEGKTSRILNALNIGYATYRRWLSEDPRLQMEVDLQNLTFLERLDSTGKLLACGMLNKLDADGNDISDFPGFKLYPNSQLLMFYMNSVGAKYGYSAKENLMDAIESGGFSATKGGEATEGIDIEQWIRKEAEEKELMRKNGNGDVGGADGTSPMSEVDA